MSYSGHYGEPDDQTAPHSELVIGLVAAVGTDVSMVAEEVSTELTAYNYASVTFRLSDYLAEQTDDDYSDKCFDEALWAAMDEGDELRRRWERGDALALHAVSEIVATRHERSESDVEICPGEAEPANLDRQAFILRSLKTPHELESLRAIYGARLVVVGAYSPDDKRLEHVGEEIQRSRKNSDRTTWVRKPEELIERDRKGDNVRGQDVSGTFHRADFFIRAWSRDVARDDLKRTMSILFGDPFRTPNRDEYGQFQAAGSALRSSEFGRQVGAAIATPGGSVVALGANEVPQFGGGSHWEDDGFGNRDFEVGDKDTNRKHLDDLTGALTGALSNTFDTVARELSVAGSASENMVEEVRSRLLERAPADLRGSGLKDLTEYGRAVHAEMNALLDAARRGVSVAGSTLHTTTFPCHNCARHLVGAGIGRVVFIEPYSKSRAEDLHGESIAVAHSEHGDRVAFEPFVGVAPRRYLEMFDASARARLGHASRADDQGEKQVFHTSTALPVFVEANLGQFRPALPGYRAKELLALEHFDRLTGAADDVESEDPTRGPTGLDPGDEAYGEDNTQEETTREEDDDGG